MLKNAGFTFHREETYQSEQERQSGQMEWESPIPFDSVDLPKFPVYCLPADIKDYVAAIAEATQTPVDMAGVASLTAMSVCVQGKYKIKAKADWIEPLNLYSVVVANPGERKSAIMSLITKYIEDYEREKNKEIESEVNQNRLEKRLLQKEIDKLIENAAKDPTKYKSKLKEKQDELTNFVDVKPLRLLADDASAEALTSLLAANNGKMAVISSEGGIFEILNGRYSQSVNIDTFLKAHDGDLIIIDRKGRETEYIKNPCLTVLLSVQPQVLNGLVSNEVFRGRGLTARFLYCIPESIIGDRIYDTEAIPDEYKTQYKNLCYSLLKIPQEEKAKLLYLSDEAKKVFADFFYELEPRHRNDLENMADFSGKLHGTTLRIAGILHLASNNLAETLISRETMLNAIELGYYFLEHARAAYQLMGADEQLYDAKYLLKRIESMEQTEISKRDLFQICKGKFKKIDAMESAIQILIEMEYIREIDISTGERGRPSKKIIVNPMLKNIKNIKKRNY